MLESAKKIVNEIFFVRGFRSIFARETQQFVSALDAENDDSNRDACRASQEAAQDRGLFFR